MLALIASDIQCLADDDHYLCVFGDKIEMKLYLFYDLIPLTVFYQSSCFILFNLIFSFTVFFSLNCSNSIILHVSSRNWKIIDKSMLCFVRKTMMTGGPNNSRVMSGNRAKIIEKESQIIVVGIARLEIVGRDWEGEGREEGSGEGERRRKIELREIGCCEKDGLVDGGMVRY